MRITKTYEIDHGDGADSSKNIRTVESEIERLGLSGIDAQAFRVGFMHGYNVALGEFRDAMEDIR